MASFEFHNPWFLLLFAPLAVTAFFYYKGKVWQNGAVIDLPWHGLARLKGNWKSRIFPWLSVLRFLSASLLIVALARPGTGIQSQVVETMGIDIVMALDVSGSMRAEDFEPSNRLQVAKEVLRDFVSRRQGDRLGMVVFAGSAWLQCPLTLEHEMVTSLIDEIDFDSVDIDGTAIGDAITLAAARLMDRDSKSRVILLVTDGMNTRGRIDPLTAAQACADMGIKIYTVGIGQEGRVPMPSRGIFGQRFIENHFDEKTMQEVSEMTGGKFYRATSAGVFWEKVKEIDRLEKNRAQVKEYYQFSDSFQWWLYAAMGFFFLELFIRNIIIRKVP